MAKGDRLARGRVQVGRRSLPALLTAVVVVLLAACATATVSPAAVPERSTATPRQSDTVVATESAALSPSSPAVTATMERSTLPASLPPPATATASQVLVTVTPPQAVASPTLTAIPQPAAGGMLGLGLRRQTVETVLKYRDRPGFVMSASMGLAETHFPQLEGWTRALGAPSLETLRQRAEEAQRRGVPYEALVYGLETSSSTPREEWQDLVGSTQQARAIADEFGKMLVMGPGFRLMAANPERYPEMAAMADMWVLQTQRLQLNPPGAAYRSSVQHIIDLIRAGNASIEVWAQITLPPDREPNAGEWLAYRQSIADLVDGTFIGVYIWDTADDGRLVATIEEIMAATAKE